MRVLGWGGLVVLGILLAPVLLPTWVFLRVRDAMDAVVLGRLEGRRW